MIQLPDKIGECPIEEAIFEVRYTSKYPVDAIFGILFAAIKDDFKTKPVSLPILQLPEAIRGEDPNFKYQAYHRLKKGNLFLNIGPKVLTFVNSKPYIGWKKWSNFFYDILDKILETKIVDRVERIGLRYINVFDDNIFDKVKFEVNVNNKTLKDESTNLRTEIFDEGFIKVLQIGNCVNLLKDDTKIKGSIIDIDCLYTIPSDIDFFKKYRSIIEKSHIKEKELFFSLLEDAFLKQLKPSFGER